MESSAAICGCMSVGKPGCGIVFTLHLLSGPSQRTRTASSYSTTVTPISISFAVMDSRCFGVTFFTSTSPRVAAAAAMYVPASI